MSKSIPENFTELFENIKSYLALQLDLLKLNANERIIKSLAVIIILGVLAAVIFFIFFFLSFSFAYWYGERTGNMALGFLLISGIYVLLGIVVFSLRKSLIIKPLVYMWYKTMDEEPQEITKEDEE